jgi:hypothetical protein
MRILVLTLLLARCLAGAQESNLAKSEPCVAPGEKIYQPGIDHVKPPEFMSVPKKVSEPPSTRRQVTLEVLLNSHGTICEVHIMRSTNVENSRKVAENVAQNSKFNPATRYGKPVAIKFLMNFNLKE